MCETHVSLDIHKKVHLWNGNGPLCGVGRRKRHLWQIDFAAVTCLRCLALKKINERNQPQ